ncbi:MULTISPECIES: GNAT family N-acetyltransferase [Olivibacter]|uniref:GCN5-related N-acetyltransferase n=2 Tax=Sphingobacteriaceae TaxID=84566 RepID=F4C1C0_SPHS2|nr:GNAT family N-acetyltransferase [Olivibacter sp. UJ_SKK_5.1]MDX3912348.1 GNAT family N-acetyltransferase [Pseudosphingobacterium sp.]
MQHTFQIKIGVDEMDMKLIHTFLSKESYWAKDIPLELVEESLNNSYCIGVFDNNKQIAFARLITDRATFAYLADVFVIKSYRKQGVSKIMLNHIMRLPWVKTLRRMMLVTADAHSLYAEYGFGPLADITRHMEIYTPNLYKK